MFYESSREGLSFSGIMNAMIHKMLYLAGDLFIFDFIKRFRFIK